MGTEGKVDLQTLVCNDESSDNVALSTLDEIGAKVDTYYWINYGGESGNQSMWTQDYETAAIATFQPGEGVWVEGTDSKQTIQSAGQVGTKDVVVQLQYGNTMTGNCTPVSIALQDIICNDESSDNVALSTLDEIGAKIDTYYWINYGGESGDKSMWTQDYETAAEATIAPGQGLWVEATDSTQTITLPGVEL